MADQVAVTKRQAPDLTVIVCAYNRCESLRDTLAALQAQVLESGVSMEILVVDNNSTDRTREVVEETVRQRGGWPIRYVFEPTQGLSYARNRGIREVLAEFIAFTDDDVVPDRLWASRLYLAFRDHGADVVGGRVLPRWSRRPPRWMVHEELRAYFNGMLALVDRGDRPLQAAPGDGAFLVGANMSFRRSLFDEHGLFHVGMSTLGDDTEMLRRLLCRGCKIVYVPDAVVQHKVFGGRMRFGYFRRWQFRSGRSLFLMADPASRSVSGWFIWDTIRMGMGALLAYAQRRWVLGIHKDLTFWNRLGHIVEAWHRRELVWLRLRPFRGKTA